MELFKILQIIIAVLLIAVILMQNRGGGLSGIFGGGNNIYMTKRGFEKKIFVATIVLSVLFFSVSLLSVL
ncbi:preprotein translocase subunit SecG [Candidatus Falkowbacteria bacterium RIFOXYB2_FULL_47_14]|uniref:Protein-export membrane protein SecG n=1 Tax=Candidatus Falkowbacteria bacterium RIFOXYA2_FULL_47_19 TaxID=1797994 RepID=A0A1F5SGP2_9BACT|nr:MAG: preprotein translocase subunit SecG [Candidatus Falkowbacteria bacterium RIFOXYA2_FULL_47_19]OGF35590.1 MAG: preprotein translocase subunit SecG [Candidatus Falkowbacteria bacterium RIFOXYC2_FULL_46_15]OGF42926.1 MAG: preprotein translocase subunit SecG [Candidatus Falkowbacteria bacterium RIFOXYB2_FULL_47_14]